jgi:alpha-ribazole phosphatase
MANPNNSMPPTVVLVRHGATELNQEDRVRSIADVDLSEEGRQQVISTARLLRGGLNQFVRVYTSDLSRCEQTAEILANQLFLPVEQARTLRDWDMGELIGLPTDEVREEIHNYIENPRKRVPGGEPYAEFEERLRDGLRLLLAVATRQGPVIGVTHSKCIELIRAWIMRERITEMLADPETPPPGGFVAVKSVQGHLQFLVPPFEHLVKDDA